MAVVRTNPVPKGSYEFDLSSKDWLEFDIWIRVNSNRLKVIKVVETPPVTPGIFDVFNTPTAGTRHYRFDVLDPVSFPLHLGFPRIVGSSAPGVPGPATTDPSAPGGGNTPFDWGEELGLNKPFIAGLSVGACILLAGVAYALSQQSRRN